MNTEPIDYDFSDFQEESPADNVLAKIAAAASEGIRLQNELERLKTEVKQVETQLRVVTEQNIPDLMDEARQKSIETGGGIKVKVDEQIVASLPVATSRDPELQQRRSKLFKWLDAHGYGKIINRELKLTFDRDQEEAARAIESDLRARDEDFIVTRNYGIHPQTLNKFVRDALEDGVDVPTDIFGVHRRRVAKLTLK